MEHEIDESKLKINELPSNSLIKVTQLTKNNLVKCGVVKDFK